MLQPILCFWDLTNGEECGIIKIHYTYDSLSAYITLKFYYDGEELIGFNYNGDDYYYGYMGNELF